MAYVIAEPCIGVKDTACVDACPVDWRGDQLRHRWESRGIVVRAGSMRDFAEETPEAYKNVSQVVGVVARAGIAKLVARLEPLAVVKG